jgi:chromosome segregation ATPase
MVGRWLLIGGLLLLVSLLFIGCGVPQQDYDAVVAERDSAQTELQSVKTELSASQAKVSELTSSIETLAAELETIKEVYPPRHFNTVKELQDWLDENDVSERPTITNC